MKNRVCSASGDAIVDFVDDLIAGWNKTSTVSALKRVCMQMEAFGNVDKDHYLAAYAGPLVTAM